MPFDRDTNPAVPPPPSVGQDIYVGTSLYLSRGRDDFIGGLGEVTKVEYNHGTWFVTIKERPGTAYNWDCLKDNQEKWREEFGNRRSYPCPDDSPESNSWY